MFIYSGSGRVAKKIYFGFRSGRVIKIVFGSGSNTVKSCGVVKFQAIAGLLIEA